MASGTVIFGVALAVAFALVICGTCVELSGCGDRQELKRNQEAELLYEAAKFRRLTQYESVLLQRKTPGVQKLLAFSFLRNGVLLNI